MTQKPDRLNTKLVKVRQTGVLSNNRCTHHEFPVIKGSKNVPAGNRKTQSSGRKPALVNIFTQFFCFLLMDVSVGDARKDATDRIGLAGGKSSIFWRNLLLGFGVGDAAGRNRLAEEKKRERKQFSLYMACFSCHNKAIVMFAG
jgi:hypothetical protein